MTITSKRTAAPAEPTAIPMMAVVGKGVGEGGAKNEKKVTQIILLEKYSNS